MTKKLLLAIAAILSVLYSTAQSAATADDLLKEACSRAGKENKKVMVIFTASWCGWCHRMKKNMEEADVKPFFNQQFETLLITVLESPDKKSLETPGGAAFFTKYGGDGKGIPFWLVFDKNGNLLADSMKPDGSPEGKANTGCPYEKDEVAYFIEVLKKTTTLNEDQLRIISQRFIKKAE